MKMVPALETILALALKDSLEASVKLKVGHNNVMITFNHYKQFSSL